MCLSRKGFKVNDPFLSVTGRIHVYSNYKYPFNITISNTKQMTWICLGLNVGTLCRSDLRDKCMCVLILLERRHIIQAGLEDDVHMCIVF
jgi:hypothetical protein